MSVNLQEVEHIKQLIMGCKLCESFGTNTTWEIR